MPTAKGRCDQCNHGTLFSPGGEVAFPECPKCKGTTFVEVELEPGLKATCISGGDRYAYQVTAVFSKSHLCLLSEDLFPLNPNKIYFPIEITLRRDGAWREKGTTKSWGGQYELGYAEERRNPDN